MALGAGLAILCITENAEVVLSGVFGIGNVVHQQLVGGGIGKLSADKLGDKAQRKWTTAVKEVLVDHLVRPPLRIARVIPAATLVILARALPCIANNRLMSRNARC